jgi:hypothetical protein
MSSRLFAAIVSVVFLYGCAATGDRMAASGTSLVGAWEVSAQRSSGTGKNLLTFSSDGTFFRSGDTHPTLSGAHGAWKVAGPNLYQGTYVAFLFDKSGKWVGYARNNLEVSLSPDGNEFKGTARVSTRDLQDRETAKGSVPLVGKRIQVQPF